MQDAPSQQEMAVDARGRLAFLQVTPDTTRTLAAFRPHVQAALPDILDLFDRHMATETVLARLIGTQTDRLKRTRITHWERLFFRQFRFTSPPPGAAQS